MTTSYAAAASHHHKFSQTCNLLSQYLKENGSIRDLNLGLPPPTPHGLTTKNLLPKIEKSGQSQIQDLNLPATEERAQMTIFYNGQVIVCNEFSQDKAKQIMDLASQVFPSATTPTTTSGGTPAAESVGKFVTSSSRMALTNGLMSSQPLCEGDMPIMRNASLARFIAKRKDRIRARAPYSDASSSSSSVVDNNKTWLGLSTKN